MGTAHYQWRRLLPGNRWCEDSPGRRHQSCFIVQAPPTDVVGKRGIVLEEGKDLPIKSSQLGREVAEPCGELLSEDTKWAAAWDGKLARGKTQWLVNYMRRAGDQREGSRSCIFPFFFPFNLALNPHSIQATQHHKWILSLHYPVEQGGGQTLGEPNEEQSKWFICMGSQGLSNSDDVSPNSTSSPQRHASPKAGGLVSNLLVFIWEERFEDKKNTNRGERNFTYVQKEKKSHCYYRSFPLEKTHYCIRPHSGTKLSA